MTRDIIVIGASAGGVEALQVLLGSLPARTRASFFVVLHLTPYNKSYLPNILSRSGQLLAVHAEDRMPIRPGLIYVAPPDRHLLLHDGVVRLGRGPKENRQRPAIDVLFRSAAKAFGHRVAAVLLTGNLDDGVSGLLHVRERGGLVLVQDPEEALYPDMPRAALRALKPDHCLPLEELETLVKKLQNSTTDSKRKLNSQLANMKPKGKDKRTGQGSGRMAPPSNGKPMSFVCPECHGPLWEVKEGKGARYQCLVGHRFGKDSMLAEHGEALENALWVALRTIEERVLMQRRLAEQSGGHAQRVFLARAKENERHAKTLRQVLDKFAK